MKKLKRASYIALSCIFIAVFIFALIFFEDIPKFPKVVMLFSGLPFSIMFAVLAIKTRSGKNVNTEKSAISKENLKRLNANRRKLERFSSMSFAKQFKTFL